MKYRDDFKDYRLIETKDTIELRFIPVRDEDKEVNFVINNTKKDKYKLDFNLDKVIDSNEQRYLDSSDGFSLI